ncbi:protein ren [Klebsiella variicola subsp. variicola]|uniref:protein ren n=1 Tax=Klebsiella variicola TaxID=244366 RepID=UPI001E31A501|nr:protein ren [Klebsiella variicola]MCD9775847.1 protein ren [Klebsiella variicola subsp. variicola]
MTSREAIKLYLKKHDKFRNDQVAAAFGLTREAIARTAREMARAGDLVIEWYDKKRIVYRKQRVSKPATSTNDIFAQCRQSPAMQRVLFVFGSRASARHILDDGCHHEHQGEGKGQKQHATAFFTVG